MLMSELIAKLQSGLAKTGDCQVKIPEVVRKKHNGPGFAVTVTTMIVELYEVELPGEDDASSIQP